MELIKKDIYNFIKNTFDEYTYDRMKEFDECHNECVDDQQYQDINYYEFLEHNENCINDLSDDDLYFIQKLCNKITIGEINISDEESHVVFRACTIYFDMDDCLVIMNPR